MGRYAQGVERQGGRRLGIGVRVTLFIVGALIAAAAPAAAYFTVGVTTTGSYSAAIADSLNGGNTPTLPTGGINGENVTIKWTASTIVHDGQAATGYTINRYSTATGGTATPATGGCAGTVSALTCTEQNVTPGNWWYTVTPLYHAWTGPESGRLAVTVGAPTFSITSGQSLPTTGGSISGGTVSNFGNSENVTFHLDSAGGTLLSTTPVTVTTSGTGSATVTSIAIPTGQTAGTHTIVAVGVTSALRATSNTFSVFGAAAKLVLSAQSTTPTAGAGDNLTITAEDSGGNTVTSYAGSKNLTFTGANVAPNGTTHPTVTNSSGTAINFGSTTAISFTNGVAQVSGSNNGVMTLFKAETALIKVSDGTINNGTGLSITVSAATAAGLGFTNATIDGGTVTTVSCTGTVGSTSFSCTLSPTSGNGSGHSMTANVTLIDQFQNLATNTSGSTITVSLAATGGTVSPSSVTLANGSTTSSGTFTDSLSSGNGPSTITATATVNSNAVQGQVTDR